MSLPLAPPSAMRSTAPGDRLRRAVDAALGISGAVARQGLAPAERLWLEAVSRPELSAATRRAADLPIPPGLRRTLYGAYARLYGVDLADAADPLEAYPSFNAFFTRALRPGARPITAEDGALACPADARLDRMGPLDASGLLPQVKGERYTVAELLGDEAHASRFTAGRFSVLYLSPRDYHRVHCPADATLRALRPVAGRLYPVNALATRHLPRLFAINERLVFDLDSERFGPIALVMVAATNVGRITTGLAPGDRVAKGAELGVFNLGSTVVLLSSDPRLVPADLVEGAATRVGQAISRLGARG